MDYDWHFDLFKSDTWVIFHQLDGNIMSFRSRVKTFLVMALVTVLVGWMHPVNTYEAWVYFFNREEEEDGKD